MKLHWQILVALGLGAKRNWHIFFALVAGVLVGLMLPALNKTAYFLHVQSILSFAGQVFIRLIQMVVIPLVVSAIIVGIASLGDSKQLGKIGARMVFYYLIIAVIAVSIGAVLCVTLKPGEKVQATINQQQAVTVQSEVDNAKNDKVHLSQMYLNMIPKNPIEALSKAELVPILIFTIVFGCAFAAIGDLNRPVVSFFESLFAATMRVTDWIMVLATPGIFALTATAVSTSGVHIFSQLWPFVSVVLLGLAIQILVTYPLLLKLFGKINFTHLYKAITEAMMVAFGTASSSATLPVTIACCERRAGISSKICSFVLPLGITMSKDGTALFQTVSIIFIAQAYGVHLDMFSIIQICALAIIASSSTAGIPSAGLITMTIILNSLGLTPDEVMQGFALLFAIDRLIDMFRTVVNVTSETVIASIIAVNEGELDFELLGNQEVWKEVV